MRLTVAAGGRPVTVAGKGPRKGAAWRIPGCRPHGTAPTLLLMPDEKHCPTCGGPPQQFRRTNKEEQTHIAGRVGLKEAPGYWRCGTAGCLWVQPYFNRAKGFVLPESFG
jgi:hypothetical protein